MSDRIMGGIGLALSIFYIWAASIIPESFMTDAIGPSTFPVIVGAVLGLCSITFIAKPDPNPSWPALKRFAEIGFALIVLFLYARLLPDIGFLISTTLATAYLTWRLGSRPLSSVVIGILTALGIYGVFNFVLGISLAEGPFGF